MRKWYVARGAGERARALLQGVSDRSLSRSEVEAAALALATDLFTLSECFVDADERKRRQRLARLLDDPKGQLLSVFLTDRVARDKTFQHAVGQLRYLLRELGAPTFMTPLERVQLGLGGAIGGLAPQFVGKLIARHIRQEVKGLVFPVEAARLRAFLQRRAAHGVSVNVNQLGEEVLGESEAERRVGQYIELLKQPDVQTISVKLSSIFSQVDLFAWSSSRARLSERLRQIYRAAFRTGSARSKLVYLDMEAYRDLRFTIELVQGLLDEPEFLGLSAGLVLQAYVPDSAALQRRLTEWALARRRRGGAALVLRVVKGANLAAERVHSARMNWPLPIYPSKHEVDANYKRMLYVGTEPAHADAVQLGIASHNIFDLAFGLVLRASRGVGANVGFEVLEGMANSVQKALSSLGAPVLTYAPAVSQDELDTAVAYLIRRLDENTASENYLRHAFSMRRGDSAYVGQARRFRDAHQACDAVSEAPRRSQDRFGRIEDLDRHAPFANEPDTDFSVAAHRASVTRALHSLMQRPSFDLAPQIAAVRRESGDLAPGFDPSRPGFVPYRYHLAPPSDLEAAVAAAHRARGAWDARGPIERLECVRRVARGLRRRRAELIAALLLDAGKRVVEADSEVSEAVDFAEYYLRLTEAQARESAVSVRPKGVVLVTSPWNFPLAIPLSGVLAALLAGNTVVFKPAPETPFVGEQLASIVWEAGVPQNALQFVLCRDEDGSCLLRHPAVSAVVLTGATSTARFFLSQRPNLDLHAETGGKNAMIVSALADRELAIRDLVASAFGYAGQKCSAASLAILAREVYDDPHFRDQLRDAASSLPVGSAWEAASVVTPLINPPGETLQRGLTRLDPGESWLLEPRCDPNNSRLWSPGIKWGVTAGGFSHQTELFGPVLSVLRADHFEHSLQLANATSYGLTSGLHSLDEREQARFMAEVACGNLYVNRSITGAIVGRQPFGGHKASSAGPGAKAGGPNYVLELQDWADAKPERPLLSAPGLRRTLSALDPLMAWARERLESRDLERLTARAHSYADWLEQYFRREHVTCDVLGQDNRLVYQLCGPVLVVADVSSRVFDLVCVSAAARLAGSDLQLSMSPTGGPLSAPELDALATACGFSAWLESPDELADRLERALPERIRWLTQPPREPAEVVLRAAAKLGTYVSTRPVLGHGRYELLFYHREQSISLDYHRYGHLGWQSVGMRPSALTRSPSK